MRRKAKVRVALWVLGVAVALVIGLGVLFALGRLTSLWGSPAAIVVNGEQIGRAQFEQAYRDLLEGYRAALPADERAAFDRQLLGAQGAHYRLSLRAEAAETLIRRSLLLQEARELGIKVSDEEVKRETQARLRRFLEESGVPPDQIERTLKDPQAYRSAFTRSLMDQIRWQLLEERLRRRVARPPEPSEAQLRRYYEQYRLRYYVPPLVRVRHILIKLPKDAGEEELAEARARLEELKRRIEEGADFAELARQHSEDALTAPQGGDMGWIQEGDPSGEDFVELAFSLEPGKVGGPVRSRFGLELIRVEERRPAVGETFEEVADQVRRDYLAQETRQAYRRWFDELYASAQVEIRLPLIEAFRLEEGDPQAARRRYEELREADGVDDPYLGYYIARLYRQELEAVQTRLTELPQDDPRRSGLEAEAERLRGRVVENLKDVVARGYGDETVFRALLELVPQDVEMRFKFARTLLRQGRRDDAVAQLAQVARHKAPPVEALALYGRLLLSMQRYDQAAQALARALAAWPSDDTEARRVLRLSLARAHRGAGQVDQARRVLQALLAEAPQHVGAHTLLGELALEAGEAQTAVEHFRAALEGQGQMDSDQAQAQAQAAQAAEIRAKLGQAYLLQGALDDAEEALREALQADAPPEEAYLWLGRVYERRGQPQRALAQYRLGLERAVGWGLKERLAQSVLVLAPDDVDARLALAELYEQRGRDEEAVAQYQAVLARRPELNLKTYRKLGDLQLELGRYDEALAAFHRALTLEPTPLEAAGLWARVLRAERVKAAKGPLGPGGLEALYELARLNVQEEDYEGAANYLAQLREASPTYRADEVAQMILKLREQGVELPEPESEPEPESD